MRGAGWRITGSARRREEGRAMREAKRETPARLRGEGRDAAEKGRPHGEKREEHAEHVTQLLSMIIEACHATAGLSIEDIQNLLDAESERRRLHPIA